MILSWVRHGRSHGLAAALGLPAVDVLPSQQRAPVLRRYAEQTSKTLAIVRRERPSQVIVMLPPLPALLSVMAARPRGATVVADLHSGVFNDPKWAWACALTLRLLRHHAAIVTNRHLAEECRRRAVRAFVLHDVLTERGSAEESTRTVLCPLSFATDEPVDEILAAANLLPDTEWWLTGTPPAEMTVPPNVRLVGFLPEDQYAAAMAAAGVIVALTTRPHTMQRAGYEALMTRRPLVTSDMPLLREFHGPSAIYTQLKAADIAVSVRRALENNQALMDSAAAVLRLRMAEQARALTELRSHLGAS